MLSKKFVPIVSTTAFTGLLLGIPLFVSAWTTNQSASAVCLANNTAAIRFSFTNTESAANLGMKVTAKDSQTGITIDMGTIAPHQTKSGEIDTAKNELNSGVITFLLKWANGHAGTHTRTAGYSSVKCIAPTPTPTATPTPRPTTTPTPRPSATPTPTLQPSATPTPTLKPSETPMPTATPTPTVQPTETPTPMPSSTPTPIQSGLTPTPTTVVTNTNDNTNTNNNNSNATASVNQTITQTTVDVNVTVQ